ncbi:serine carboxypeptidase-like protein [Carex littledalei]|uniref:Carboxypeptidase n=1 Tax=Carex littledalei TaxID=544730 RepID=A0A833QG84_9POAL|nr:serine carboxypeptidase-like protein [Carex littledalei]
MDNVHFSLLLITISIFSFSCASLIPSETIIFPSIQAKNHIKSLNLTPKESSAVPSIRHAGTDSRDVKLVEKQINLIDGTESGKPAPSLGHHAGYYQLPHTHDARMFYLFFESRHSKSDPVVIWLTGGPGCSSELALFYENGPFVISKNLSLAWNDYGWDQVSNLLYVDQPTGTGYSYSSDTRDLRHDEVGVSNDLYDFLQEFFAKHPEYAKNDFYITGESYAGHYIPALANRVHQGNKAKEGLHINLKGFAIGNGLTNPEIQYKAYTDYALEMNLIQKSDYESINKIYPECQLATKFCGTSGKISCTLAYVLCNTIFSSVMKIAGNKNYYDVRKKCEGDLCYDFSDMEKYLKQKSVREALGVPAGLDFVSCSTSVHEAMVTDWMRNLEVGIPSLLEDGIKVLIYAGEYDLICNWLGNSRWVQAMEWSGQKDFVATHDQSFTVDNKEAGVLKSHGALSFLKVHNAGHMVPMDQPKAALEMLSRWTQGKLADSNPKSQSSTHVSDEL